MPKSIKLFMLSVVALAGPVIAQAESALQPIGEQMERQFDVKWQKDGFIFTLKGIPIQHPTSNTALDLNGAQVKAYTQPPLNQPLMAFGGIYDGKDFLQGTGAIGVLFGIFNSCQGYKNNDLASEMSDFLVKVQQKGKYTFSKTINGAHYKLYGTLQPNGLYHLDYFMRYPAGTIPKCSFSK